MVNIESVLEVLRSGGIVMHPTETCYGLAADIMNSDAISKIYELKGRPADNPISILVDSLGMALRFGEFSPKALDLAAKHWPGPLSLVVPRSATLPDFFNPGQEFVSIRYSSDDFSSRMVSAFGSPLTTTSANLSGQPPLYNSDISAFGEKSSLIGLVVDGGLLLQKPPSTILKVVGDEVFVLRQGELKV